VEEPEGHGPEEERLKAHSPVPREVRHCPMERVDWVLSPTVMLTILARVVLVGN
jgi:hypothetical protein